LQFYIALSLSNGIRKREKNINTLTLMIKK
jgi:hypothetical protein